VQHGSWLGCLLLKFAITDEFWIHSKVCLIFILYTERRYCEENIYKLLTPLSQSRPCRLCDLTVIFISNPQRIVIAPQMQRLNLDTFVVSKTPKAAQDTGIMGLPCNSPPWQRDIRFWFYPAFPVQCRRICKTNNASRVASTGEISKGYILLEFYLWRVYRMIPGDVFFKTFSSSRKHMLKDGQWSSPPPNWPPIQNQG
jgi:N-terminal glutamine amidase